MTRRPSGPGQPEAERVCFLLRVKADRVLPPFLTRRARTDAMKVGARSTTGWKATISVAMSNYIEAGSIIAIATSLAFWQEAYGISDLGVGLLAALSANAFGA